MKKIKWLWLIVAIVLLLGGCKKEAGFFQISEVFKRTETSIKDGHLFFTGKVVSVAKDPRQITYYDEQAELSTFYTVEITEDYFEAMPDRQITVCIFGTSANNGSRNELQKGKEYLFDVSPYMLQNEVVFLLPSFYTALAQREGDTLFYMDGNVRYGIEGTYTQYKEELKQLAQSLSYGPAVALKKAKTNFERSVNNDTEYFTELKFENLDADAIQTTVAAAKLRLQRLALAGNSWKDLREVLQ
jgi:hypothetical protein